MPHVLVAGKIHAAGVALLKAAGMTTDYVEDVTHNSYVPFLNSAEAVLLRTQPMRAADIALAPRLKIVSRHGVGYDAVDVEALSARGIALAIVGDVNSRAVAEHTLMLMLAAARRAAYYDAASRNGRWNDRNAFDGMELDGKNLLLMGFGRIGRRVAEIALAFGMEVQAFDPFVEADVMAKARVKHVAELNEALARADYVSVHMPGSGGEAMIGEQELERMKPSAIIVNAARGGLIDEAALDHALRSGRLAGAALDVLAEEPPALDHPLLSNPRVTITPHTAGLTTECTERMAISAAQNIIDCFAGKLDPGFVVNAARIGLAGQS
jgi:D-3-phosphoglycerate dehydrogenase / 2-oxoglutarate reductase